MLGNAKCNSNHMERNWADEISFHVAGVWYAKMRSKHHVRGWCTTNWIRVCKVEVVHCALSGLAGMTWIIVGCHDARKACGVIGGNAWYAC